jgi:four helix bundle protein
MTPHRKLAAWQTARLVVRTDLRASRQTWKPYLSAVFSQLQRSSLSVQLNIAEGYAYGPTRRCRNYLEIAYASAVETEDLLDLLADERVLPPAEATEALNHCRRCQALLKGLIRRYQST